MIETRHLRYFVAVAEMLHFGRAAERLNIAQPALSRQIQQLEQELGVLLLERTQRRVRLTAAGRLYLERATRLLDELAKATGDVRRAHAGHAGRLSVGFIHSSTYSVTPAILGQYHASFPDVELVLHEMTIFEQFRALRENVIDVGILRPPVGDPHLSVMPFRDEDFLIVAPETHPLAGKGNADASLADMAAETFVLFEQRKSPLFHSRIISMCEAAGFVPQVEQYANQIHTVLGLVRAGMGISIVPEVARNLHMPGIRFLPIRETPPPVQVALAWRSLDETPTVHSFRAMVADMFPAKPGAAAI
ncbi:LysR family transcriptional regulator [Oceanibaculum pacificum]|uniref:LysR family transcriptional regulator n=1 Tax=Oceanibaculum pacificum TaxID=580166 RepID=A0A154VI01_9PROT|nr:LysR family transcriptional regulator [Oceanibaculum pacificum]KZD01057.1 LysR family transcriptional regulator [Oceanibaculum pacificum]